MIYFLPLVIWLALLKSVDSHPQDARFHRSSLSQSTQLLCQCGTLRFPRSPASGNVSACFPAITPSSAFPELDPPLPKGKKNKDIRKRIPRGNYKIGRRIGSGTYSTVFEATHVKTKAKVVLKRIKQTDSNTEYRIKTEIQILRYLKGGPHIIELLDVIRDPESNATSLVFEYVNNTRLDILYPTLTDLEVRWYIYQILKALDFAHSNGVMHRDIKFRNVVVDHEKGELKLIDWGLSNFYHPGGKYTVTIGTRRYKAPELFLYHKDYDYSIDIWSLGVMLAGMMFHTVPFFNSTDPLSHLATIVHVLGTDGFYEYIDKYKLDLDAGYANQTEQFQNHTRKPWIDFVNPQNQHLCSTEALDLINQMLVYDPAERILASEAIIHPYFNPVRF